jgi:hypothetical protein
MANNQGPELWQCHLCKCGPYKVVNTPKCVSTSCTGHEMCDKCPKDGDIPHKLTLTALDAPLSRSLPTKPHINRNRYQNPISYTRGPRGHLGLGLNGLSSRPRPRPPTRGWWRCSECRNVNNPALSSGVCTSCNHQKCKYCTPVQT